MSRNTKSALIGKWRIVEMELWDTDYLDMVEPAYIRFDPRAGGEFVFGTVTGGLDCRHTGESVDFTWQGNSEMDEASGSGWAGQRQLSWPVQRQLSWPVGSSANAG
jgi:hypothetical protein